LLDIIQICKSFQINLIGIKFPLSKTYIETIKNLNYGADEILKRKQIQILDFKLLFEGDDTYFLNQDHLNRKGGEKFTKKLFQ
jgi:hypothetical protein